MLMSVLTSKKNRRTTKMDVTQYGESDYITAEIVKQSKSKTCVVIGDATVEDTKFGDKMQILVEIDGKKKKYRPNKDTIKNLIETYGRDSKAWLGKEIRLQVISNLGKECVVGSAK